MRAAFRPRFRVLARGMLVHTMHTMCSCSVLPALRLALLRPAVVYRMPLDMYLTGADLVCVHDEHTDFGAFLRARCKLVAEFGVKNGAVRDSSHTALKLPGVLLSAKRVCGHHRKSSHRIPQRMSGARRARPSCRPCAGRRAATPRDPYPSHRRFRSWAGAPRA